MNTETNNPELEWLKFESDDEETQLVFSTMHEWLEELRGEGKVDMMDTYKAMMFVGLTNLVYLQNYTKPEIDEVMEILKNNTFELLEMFGDREGIFDFLANKDEPLQH
tara:strand:+ start:167 stop:490 length:324 start_codon:yes stop_codon:yes gene_type:complete